MLHPQSFIHPEDAAALQNLEAVPGLPLAVKAFLKYGLEKFVHGVNMASKIRLSATQLPAIYRRLPPICEKLGIAEPEFYLEMDPQPNACTFGDSQISITVTSGLLEYLDDGEINSVLAHECGHIACRHVLYHSMAALIVEGSDFFGALGSLLLPLKYALQYWSRKSELSADRAAALVCGADGVVATQVRLAGGPQSVTSGINIEEWARQADAYEDIRDGKTWDKLLQVLATMNNDHPFAAVRVREILRWSKTEQYQKLRAAVERGGTDGLCPNCLQPTVSGWAFCKHCGAKLG